MDNIGKTQENIITTFSKNDRFYVIKGGVKQYGTIICDRHNVSPSHYLKHTYKVVWDVDNVKKDDTIYGYLFEMIKV